MSIESHLQDRAARWKSAPPGIDEVIAFIEEAAELIGSAPVSILGPGVKFRWLVDGHVIEVRAWRANHAERFNVQVSGVAHQTVVNKMEHQRFQNWDDQPVHYLWRIDVGESPPGWDPWLPQLHVVSDWDEFEQTIAVSLMNLPIDYALIPEIWRPPLLGYRFRDPAGSDGSTISFFASPDGLRIEAPERDRTGLDLLIPTHHLETYTVEVPAMMAGLLGRHWLHDAHFVDAPGFDWCAVTPGPDDHASLQVVDWPGRGYEQQQLVELIAAPAQFAGSPGLPYGRLRMSLGLDAAVELIGDLVAVIGPSPLGVTDPAVRQVLSRWGVPEQITINSEYLSLPIGFFVERGRLVLRLHPGIDRYRPEDKGTAGRQLADACAARFGPPIAWSSGVTSPHTAVFDFDGTGVRVNSDVWVGFTIDRTEALLASFIG